MKIMVMIPGEAALMPEAKSKVKEELMQFASQGTEIEVYTTKGAKEILRGRDIAMIVPSAVETAIKGEKDGFDAIMLYAIWNFGLEAVREAVDIPVVAGGEVVLHVAAMIADRFGVVTMPDEILPEILRRWRLVGIAGDHITSVRPINIPVTEIYKRKDELEAKFIEIAKKQIEEEGAQAIVPGCFLYLPALGPNSRARLEDILSVPVIPSAPLLIKFAEMMVVINLKHSKKAYPK